MEIEILKAVKTLGQELDGVFTIRDLEVVLSKKLGASFYRTIAALVSSEELIKVKRGLYATKDATLVSICNRICPESYISMGTVLAQNALIGSIPARKIQAVKLGRPRTFLFPFGTIEYLSINPKLFFGFTRKDNVNWATPEKAFLDVCYYTYKGKKFSFDPYTDINLEELDFKTIKKSLIEYDKRFITFFNVRWLEDEEQRTATSR